MNLAKGILTGIMLSLPFGPVGIYTMEITLIEGRWKGYATSLGMVTIDVLYSVLALLFLENIEGTILKYEKILSVGVGFFLIGIALKKLVFPIKIKEISYELTNFFQNYLTGLLFSLANITGILTVAMMFTTLKVFNSDSHMLTQQIAIGVFLGGAGLWFFTTTVLSIWRNSISKKQLISISKIASIFILIFGVFIVINSFYPINFLVF